MNIVSLGTTQNSYFLIPNNMMYGIDLAQDREGLVEGSFEHGNE
jgi:hypothetical protein